MSSSQPDSQSNVRLRELDRGAVGLLRSAVARLSAEVGPSLAVDWTKTKK